MARCSICGSSHADYEGGRCDLCAFQSKPRIQRASAKPMVFFDFDSSLLPIRPPSLTEARNND